MRRAGITAAAGLALVFCGCVSLRPLVGGGASDAPRPDAAADGGSAPAVAPDPAPPKPARAEAELPAGLAAKACFRTAEELVKRGLDAEAAGQYERARQLDPKMPGVAARLGAVYGRLGVEDKAAAEFEIALKAAPDDADLLNDAGYFHTGRGDWEAAERYLGQAVRKKPDHARAWLNLGTVYAKTGRTDEGRRAFARALPPAQAEYNLGVVLAGQGQGEEARACFRAALARDPGLVKAGEALKRLDQPPPAVATGPAEKPRPRAEGATPPPPGGPAGG